MVTKLYCSACLAQLSVTDTIIWFFLGNLVNIDTKWNITGSLIKKVDLKESDIFCTEGRTLYIPVRYLFPPVGHIFTFFISQVPDFPGRHGHLRGDGRKRKLLEEVRDFWGVRHLPRECEEEQSHRRLLRTWRQIYILAAVQARQLLNSVKNETYSLCIFFLGATTTSQGQWMWHILGTSPRLSWPRCGGRIIPRVVRDLSVLPPG